MRSVIFGAIKALSFSLFVNAFIYCNISLVGETKAYSDFGMQCAEYKAKTIMKYDSDKAEENGADADDSVKFTKNKRKVEGAVW